MTKRGKGVDVKVTIAIMAILLWVSGANGAIEKRDDVPRRDRYLLLDSRIIESTGNAILTVGAVQKDKRNPLFKEDKPWEPRYDNVYCNVIYDEQDKLYKCWYSPFIIDERTTSTPGEKRNPESQDYMSTRPNGREMGVCYAFSRDGIHWEKPELGLVEFGGNEKNNILMRGQEMRGMFRGPHGAGVFKDLRESDLARRYKMFFRAEKMAVAFSPDGVHWDEPILCREIDAPGDTHNNAFWDPMLGKYVGITRLKTRDNIRLVGRTESSDFVNWTKAKVVLEGIKPQLQTHDMEYRFLAIFGRPSEKAYPDEVIGCVPMRGEKAVRALLLGEMVQGRLMYKGKVGSGLTRRQRQDFLAELTKAPKLQEHVDCPSGSICRLPGWRCRVRYFGLTEMGHLRSPTFKGLI